jgi:hypothetical protein
MLFYHKISFGSACDNRCVGCEAEDDTTSRTLDDLIRQVDGLDDLENVVLLGGEPTLHNDLISLVSYARKRSAKRIKLVTNGRRLSDMDFLVGLVEAGCRVFEVKLEGASPEIHEAVTGAGGSFGATMQGLENFGGLGQSEGYEDAVLVAVRVGVTGRNLADLVPTVSLLTSLGVDRIVLARRSCDFSMEEGSFLVANALRVATLNRTWSQCEGFPPCLMRGCERHLSECLDPNLRPGEKPKGCRKCVYERFCCGPPEDYVRERGSKEYRAVSTSPYLEDIKRLHAMRFSHGQP